MRLHANAALTIKQRQEVKRLHEEQKMSVRKLAARFGVNPTTIQRWVQRDEPEDHAKGPKTPHRVVTADYQQAVMTYRQAHPQHGPIRIAHALKAEYAHANRGTVLRILQAAGLTRCAPRKKPDWHIPVGRHRVQADVQQLPAVGGGAGFEYKYSFIHLNTRMKYSEIHTAHSSDLAAHAFQQALRWLPPFSSLD
jgi:transposase-like protein